LEVVTVRFSAFARHSHRLEVEAVHLLDDALARRVLKRVIEELT
jgi:hypothetical protein